MIYFILGTRPEVTKAAPFIYYLLLSKISYRVILTGQQTLLVINTLKSLKLFDHNIILNETYTLEQQILNWENKAKLFLNKTLKSLPKSVVVVVGDTNSALLGAQISNNLKIISIHLEAGIRHKYIHKDEIEEINRRKISKIVNYHFVPSVNEKENLISEGINNKFIFITNNLSSSYIGFVTKISNIKINDNKFIKPYILATFHRKSSLKFQKKLFTSLIKVMKNINLKLYIIKKPDTRWENFYSKIHRKQNIEIIDTLNPLDFHNFLKNAHIVLTDSAGVQQEATYLKKTIIVLRKQIELNKKYNKLYYCPPPYINLKLFLMMNIHDRNYYNKLSLINKSKHDTLRVCNKLISIQRSL